MTFKKKDTKVPDGYNLNFDKETKRWRLRIKRDGKWETAGRFATEELAIAFANQSNRFKTQIAESKKPKVAKETVSVVKEELSSHVEEKKDSPLEKVRKATKKKSAEIDKALLGIPDDSADMLSISAHPAPQVEITDVQASPSFPEEVFSVFEKASMPSHYTSEPIIKLEEKPHEPLLIHNIEFLKMQSRVADLQHSLDQTNHAITKAVTGIEIQVDQLDKSNKSVIGVSKEFDRLRENLRSIMNERVEPLSKDIQDLRGQLHTINTNATASYQELLARFMHSISRIQALELQASYTKTGLIVLGLCSVIAMVVLYTLGFLR